MSPSDILTLIGKTNKISVGFFVITCVLLSYELFLYFKEKKGSKKPTIPLFKKGGGKEPLSVHSPKPMPMPPEHPHAPPKQESVLPPLISQMSPPTMKHTPGQTGKKKKKLSRGAKVTAGATLALLVLTVGIAWRLNQPSSQQASNSTSARADEQLTPGAGFLPSESSGSALTMPTLIPTITGRALIPTITPRSDILDLGQQGSTDQFEPVATPTSTLSSDESATESATTSSTETTSDSESSPSSELSQLPMTGGSESSAEATLAPTLPIAGTIQYSIGLLVVASIIVIASLVF